MPPDRATQLSTKLSASDALWRAMGLQEKPNVYEPIEEQLRKNIDITLDISLPALEQQGNMQRFVEKAFQQYPGYFDNTSPRYRERVMALHAYGSSCLNAMLSGEKQPKKARARGATPFPSPPKGNIIKAARPRPKPTYRAKKKIIVPGALREALPIDSDTDCVLTTMDTPSPSDVEDTDLGGIRLRGRRQSFGGKPPSPSPEPELGPDVEEPEEEPEQELAPAPQPEAETSPEPEPELAIPADPIQAFLDGCHPPMPHLADSLRRAGVTTHHQLLAIARWGDEDIRRLLTKTAKVAQTALEEEALIIGLSGFLSDEVSRTVEAYSK